MKKFTSISDWNDLVHQFILLEKIAGNNNEVKKYFEFKNLLRKNSTLLKLQEKKPLQVQ